MTNAIRLTQDQVRKLGPAYSVSGELSGVKARAKPVNTFGPQWQLWQLVKAQYPDAAYEHGDVVPGRKYTVDVALPQQRVAVEIDGWQYHGKHLKDFKRDREKDRALVLSGWRVLRFYASEVNARPRDVMATIDAVVGMSV